MPANINIETRDGGDINNFTAKILDSVVAVLFKTDVILLTGQNGDLFALRGNFTYDGEPSKDTVKSGTVTNIALQDNPGRNVYATVTNIALEVKAALKMLMTGSVTEFFDAIGASRFFGEMGNDKDNGSSEDDRFLGGGGNDELSGGLGNDVMEGNAGRDHLNGGAGIDVVSYSTSLNGVSVNLLSGAAEGADANGDILENFENLDGSNYRDTLTGDNGVNEITGRFGNDKLNGGRGADILNGGGDFDTVYYTASTGAVTINLETGLAKGGEAEGDQLILIEAVVGSARDDVLTGNHAANKLFGDKGDDVLDGGVNADLLKGASGDDRLIGGQGEDTLSGGRDNDIFVLSNAAANADTITDFVVGKDTLEIDASLFGGDLVAGQTLTREYIEVNSSGLATDRDTRFILDSDTGELFFDINGSAGGEIGLRLIATLDGILGGFSFGEFVIV